MKVKLGLEKLTTLFFKKHSRKNIFLFLGGSLFISAIYFYGMGRNRYLTASDVVIRKSNSDSIRSLTLSSLFNSGNSGSIEDSRYLQSHLNSPQVLKGLEREFDFQEKYKKKLPDLLAGLKNNPTKEQIYRFYKKQISVVLNEVSGIISVKTYGFDPESSFLLNKYLLNQAEIFTNELNQNIYREQYDFAKDEVEKNLKRVNKASQELADFQMKNKSIDLTNDALSSSNLIASLENKLAEKKVELATLKRKFLLSNAPEVIEVEALVDEIEKLITIERQLLVSPNGKNYNKKVILLNKLKSKLSFEENLYNSALSTVESTRVNSLQQQRFLASLSDPFLAEEQYFYWRHKGFLTIISIIFISYFLLKFILGLSEQHFED